MALIDLHMHTTESDGTDTPEEILALVRREGIRLFSVTDHDAVRGAAAVAKIVQDPGPVVYPRFVTGVEFSCRDEEIIEGKTVKNKYHILGYAYDPGSKAILDLVELVHRYRMDKVVRRLHGLEESFGFRFPRENVRALLSLPNPGKPHIGNLMARLGYAPTKDHAIANYINRLHIQARYVSPGEAISGILAAGGIPVLAHPSFGDGDQNIHGEDLDRRVKKLRGMGIMGLEAFYSRNTADNTREILALAEKHSLCVTAGSDYHGTNKTVRLGQTNLPQDGPVPAGLDRFLQMLRDRNPGFDL